MKKKTNLLPKSKLPKFFTLIFVGLLCFSSMPDCFGFEHSNVKAQSIYKQFEKTAINYNYSSPLSNNPGLQKLEVNTQIDRERFEKAAPGEISFNFSGYGNPQRPFPGYVGTFQLGPVKISGRGVIRAKDGKLLRGGYITHNDNLRDRRYPRHSTRWQVVKGLNVNSKNGVTVLKLLVKVVSSNYTRICPVGTQGVLTLTDDNRRMNNRQTRDAVITQMPNPFSRAADGGAACRTHVHGFNNVSYSWTNPQYGGPGGGNWADVSIAGAGSSGGNGTHISIKTDKRTYSRGERIKVSYSGLPGNSKDWITIVKAGSRAGAYGQWFYTQRRRSGTLNFSGLTAGTYEARAHYAGSRVVRARYRFTVRNTGTSCRASDWVGTWNTTYSQAMQLSLSSNGIISGTYGPRKHFISGRVQANNPCIFIGTWKHRNSTRKGRLIFKLTANKRKFEGTWTEGNVNPAGKGINWTGTKK